MSCADTVWACPFLASDVLIGRKAVPIRKPERKIWLVAPLHLFWAIWKERNRVDFESAEFSLHRLKNSFVISIWSWINIVLKQDFLYIRKLLMLFRN